VFTTQSGNPEAVNIIPFNAVTSLKLQCFFFVGNPKQPSHDGHNNYSPAHHINYAHLRTKKLLSLDVEVYCINKNVIKRFYYSHKFFIYIR
jgi:hypothetical protein